MSFDEHSKLTCSGYITFPCEEDFAEDGKCKGRIILPCGIRHDTEDFHGQLQVPFSYQIYRERAKVATCCHWDIYPEEFENEQLDHRTNPYEFDPNRSTEEEPVSFEYEPMLPPEGIEIELELRKVKEDGELGELEVITTSGVSVVGGWKHEEKPSFIIEPYSFKVIKTNEEEDIPTRCSHPNAFDFHQGLDRKPPCNGAKTSCPFYTSRNLKYIRDEQMAPGQTVMGQSVQELRALLRNWELRTDTAEAWYNSFGMPEIVGRDLEDKYDDESTVRVIQTSPTESVIVSIITRINWDFVAKDSIEIKEESDEFPTIVKNLGQSDNYLRISFPPRRDVKDLDPLLIAGYYQESNKLYFAGEAYPQSAIYLVNRTLVRDFPSLPVDEDSPDFNMIITDRGLSDRIVSHIIEERSKGLHPGGFKIAVVNAKGFWEVEDGLELEPNSFNDVFVLTQINNAWLYTNIIIDFKFYFLKLYQEGYETLLPLPSTDHTLLNTIRIARPSKDISFSMVKSPEEIIIDPTEVVKFSYLDRSNERFVRDLGEDQVLDTRTWKIINELDEPFIFEGTGVRGEGSPFMWSRVDRCNRYLVEWLQAAPIQTKSCAPPPLQYPYLIDDIYFSIDVGEEDVQIIPMKVVKYDPSGVELPARFVMIEPKDPMQNFPGANLIDTLSIHISHLFKLTSQPDTSRQDVTVSELTLGNKDSNIYEVGGVLHMPKSAVNSEFRSPLEEIEIDRNRLTINNFAGIYDLSYMIPIKAISDTLGEFIVGYRWVQGVVELADFKARDVDIEYIWQSEVIDVSRLSPDYWKIVKLRNTYDRPNPETLASPWQLALDTAPKVLVERAPCIDHRRSMFTPYTNCLPPYTIIDEVNFYINYRIPYAEAIDSKYRGPDVNVPFTYWHTVFGTLAPRIFVEFPMGTIVSGPQSVWSGVAKVRGPISINYNELLYAFYLQRGWRFPPSGNTGREIFRAFKSMHWRQFLYSTEQGQIRFTAGWMPSNPFLSVHDTVPTVQNKIKEPDLILNDIIQRSFLPEMNYNDWMNLKNLINSTQRNQKYHGDNLFTTSEDLQHISTSRKTYKDTFKVKRVRTIDSGTRWPPKGFYHNFRNSSTVWAFSEKQLPIQRNWDKYVGGNFVEQKELITGVSIRNPKIENSITDLWDRPIYITPSENAYFIRARDQRYWTNGDIREYASIHLLSSPDQQTSRYPLYFDKNTGIIQDKKYPEATKEEPYAMESLEDIIDSGFTFMPYHEPVSTWEEQRQEVEEPLLVLYNRYGNLFLNEDVGYFYFSSNNPILDTSELGEDPLTQAFIPSLEVTSVEPMLLPKVEFVYIPRIEDYYIPRSTGLFTSYPTLLPEERNRKSNIKLDTIMSLSLFSNQDVVGDRYFQPEFWWYPTTTLEDHLDPEDRSGHDGPITLKIEFRFPIEVKTIKFTMESFSISKLDYDPEEDDLSELRVPTKTFPYVKLTLGDIVVLEKPYEDPEDHPTEGRNIKTISIDFLTEASNHSTFPTTVKSIELYIGERGVGKGVALSQIFLRGLRVNEETYEEILIHEPHYLVSTGYNVDNKLFDEDGPEEPGQIKAAQNPSRLQGTIPTWDRPDHLESNGICELWLPGDYDQEETKMVGKLRRHWANQFASVDTEEPWVHKEDHTFRDLNVGQSEIRQYRLVWDAIYENARQYWKYVGYEGSNDYTIFITPYDRSLLDRYNIPLRAYYIPISFEVNPVSAYQDTEIFSRKGDLPPGWKDPGFFACWNYRSQPYHNVFSRVFGGGLAINGDHAPCNALTNRPLGVYHLFEVMGFMREGHLAGGGIDAIGIIEQNTHSPSQQEEYAQEYRRAVERLNIEYKKDQKRRDFIP